MRRIALAALSLTLLGCAAGDKPVADPVAVFNNPEEHVNVRTAAVTQAWTDARAGRLDAETVRGDLKDLLWDPTAPTKMRIAAYRALVADATPEGLDDMRRFTALRLPTEPTIHLVNEMCRTIVANKWTDLTAPLVRSLSRPVNDVPDEERPEYAALATLFPDTSIQRIAFDVFVDPHVVDGDNADQRRARSRTDAWELLGRLDPDGARRLAWAQELGDDPAFDVITWCAEELRTLPITGEELTWLDRLAQTRGRADGWWSQTAAAVALLDEDKAAGLRIRHLEPVRWAAAHDSELISQSRDELLAVLRDMDRQRRHARRLDVDSWDGPTRDRIYEWADVLTWADMLAILVVDEAIQQPRVIQMLFGQADMDMADDTTEHGGVLEFDDDAFVARHYAPRPSARLGDWRFVASPDMLAKSSFSLAHYHFHAQRRRNAEYAGPSKGDLEYATNHGRTCIVLTSIEEGVLGVDVIQPGGVAVDLGELRRQP